MSGWTGFNIKIRDNSEVVEDMVTYLPTVNGPATDTAIVQEVLNQSLKIMDNWKLQEIVCVFDQALYTKANIRRPSVQLFVEWRCFTWFAQCLL